MPQPAVQRPHVLLMTPRLVFLSKSSYLLDCIKLGKSYHFMRSGKKRPIREKCKSNLNGLLLESVFWGNPQKSLPRQIIESVMPPQKAWII